MLRFLSRRRRPARVSRPTTRRSVCVAEPCEPRWLLAAIASDETLVDSVAAPGQVDAYTFTAAAGQSIYAAVSETVAGSPLTVAIELRGPTNALVDSSSSATGTEVFAANVALAGTYTLNVTGASSTTGSYAITLALPGTAPQAGTDAGPIASAAYRTAGITPGDIDVHTIAGTAGGSLLAAIGDLDPGSAHDPQMFVFSPTGALLDSAASATGTNLLLTNLAATGTYYVVALDQFANEAGAYGLSVATFGGAQAVDADSGPIASGAYRTGAIDAGDFDVHTIAGTAGGSLLATIGDANADVADPQVMFFTPSGAFLSNAVGATGTALLASNLPTTGTYYVVAIDQFSNETGAYGLSVGSFAGAHVTDADSGPATSGERRTGTIGLGDFDVYTIQANAGSSLLATVGETATSGFDPHVMIFSPTGALLGNDAAGVGTHILLTDLASTGTYHVVVLDQFGDEPGAYALSLARFSGSQTTGAGDEGGATTSGAYRTGAVSPGDFDVYTLAASAGNTLLAALGELDPGGVLEPQFMVFSPTGALLQNTAGAAGASTLLTNLPTTGTYTVVVLDQFGEDAGDYGLTVARFGGAVAQTVSPGDEGGPLNTAERRLGRIAPGDLDSFTFDLATGAGAFWTVGETIEDAFAPRLIIVGPSGNVLSNVAGARGRDAALAAAGASPAGTYTAVVLDSVGGTPGEYALTGVTAPAAAQSPDDDHGALGAGQRRAGSLPPGDADVYTVAATAGQVLTFTLAETGPGTLTPGLIVYAPNGTIADSSAGPAITQVVIPSASAGTYTVVVEDSGGDGTGAYSVALNTTAGADTFSPRLLESGYRYLDVPPTLRLAFSEDLEGSFLPDGFVLRNLTTNQTIDPADMAISFRSVTHEVYFGFNPLPGGVLPDGNYRLTIPAANLADAAGNLLAQDVSFDFFVLAGDANRDRTVSFADLLTLAQNYNKTGRNWAQGDFTGDGLVAFADLLILAQRYNRTLPVPPPPGLPVAARPVAPATATLRDEEAARPVFSTTPIAAPAPAQPRVAVRPLRR